MVRSPCQYRVASASVPFKHAASRLVAHMTPAWHRVARLHLRHLHLRHCSGTALRGPRLAYQAAVLANELQEDANEPRRRSRRHSPPRFTNADFQCRPTGL